MIGIEGHHADMMANDTLDSPEVERMQREVLPALLTQKTWRGRVRHRRHDGSTFLSDSLAFVIHDAQGGAQAVAIVMRDVTEQDRAEQELAHTASLLHATLESTSDGILAVDTAGRVVNINQQFITRWRIPEALVATRDDAKLLQYVVDQLADPAAFIAKVNELYDQPDATSYDILSFKDGRVFSTRAQQVLETVFVGVAERGAHVAILDITGVSVVDSQVANALLRAAQAVRLLGASVVLTGIKPEVAQTLVNLGADLRGIVTRGSLQSGIAFALQQR
jgi:rsbT co-antagonist protein RsbR